MSKNTSSVLKTQRIARLHYTRSIRTRQTECKGSRGKPNRKCWKTTQNKSTEAGPAPPNVAQVARRILNDAAAEADAPLGQDTADHSIHATGSTVTSWRVTKLGVLQYALE